MATYIERELESKILTNEKREIFFKFINSINYNDDIKNELKSIIIDYNNIIMSYLSTLENMNNKTRANFPSNDSYQNYSLQHTYALNNITTPYPTSNSMLYMANNTSSEILKIKTTNDILKQINNTVDHQKFFASRYTSDKTYKTFLNNLINYKYSLIELNDIRTDIDKFQKFKPNIPSRILKEESFHDFNNSLRRYPDNKMDLVYSNYPPFIRFTKSNGDFFDKSLNRISSPLRHKHSIQN